jgi:hypothetical protein
MMPPTTWRIPGKEQLALKNFIATGTSNYDWGFHRTEQEDWDDFQAAAQHYHDLGSPVFAYIQTSNCVFAGSYRYKDWYALDQHGCKIFYYSGRYMACLSNPEWRQHLKDMIAGAIQRRADGIFLDHLWSGSMPVSLFGCWLNSAGCHCPLASGHRRRRRRHPGGIPGGIPQEIHPADACSRHSCAGVPARSALAPNGRTRPAASPVIRSAP